MSTSKLVSILENLFLEARTKNEPVNKILKSGLFLRVRWFGDCRVIVMTRTATVPPSSKEAEIIARDAHLQNCITVNGRTPGGMPYILVGEGEDEFDTCHPCPRCKADTIREDGNGGPEYCPSCGYGTDGAGQAVLAPNPASPLNRAQMIDAILDRERLPDLGAIQHTTKAVPEKTVLDVRALRRQALEQLSPEHLLTQLEHPDLVVWPDGSAYTRTNWEDLESVPDEPEKAPSSTQDILPFVGAKRT